MPGDAGGARGATGGVSDDRIWRVLKHHVGQARSKEDHATVRRIGVDETSTRRGQCYLTLFHDADARRLLFATPGRDAKTFAAFAADLKDHGGDPARITDVSMDMSKALQAGAARTCPKARITLDPFHVVALASKALDQVRRAETKLEPDLFLTVTGLTVKDFHLLVRLRVFNTEQMNQAVFAFRRYEDASLSYTGIDSQPGLTHYGLYDTVVARE